MDKSYLSVIIAYDDDVFDSWEDEVEKEECVDVKIDLSTDKIDLEKYQEWNSKKLLLFKQYEVVNADIIRTHYYMLFNAAHVNGCWYRLDKDQINSISPTVDPYKIIRMQTIFIRSLEKELKEKGVKYNIVMESALDKTEEN